MNRAAFIKAQGEKLKQLREEIKQGTSTYGKKRTCRTCGEEKPLKDFYKNKASVEGHFRRCKACMCAYGRKRYEKIKAKVQQATHIYPKEKLCSRCGHILPAEAFLKTASQLSGLSPACRTCWNAARRHAHRLLKESQNA